MKRTTRCYYIIDKDSYIDQKKDTFIFYERTDEHKRITTILELEGLKEEFDNKIKNNDSIFLFEEMTVVLNPANNTLLEIESIKYSLSNSIESTKTRKGTQHAYNEKTKVYNKFI